MDRATYNRIFTWLSILVGGISLLIALGAHFQVIMVSEAVSAFIIGIWVLFPPIFFWIDWVAFSNELNSDALRDFAKHTHDLGRNIWIALAAILVYLFGIQFPGTGGG